MGFDELRHKIPLAEAAAFFIGLRKVSSAPPTAASVMEELGQYSREEQVEILKEAGVSEEELGDVIKTASQQKNPKERAQESMATRFERDKYTLEERGGNVMGRIFGAAAGGAAGHYYGKHPLLTLGGAALGQSLGGAIGGHVGRGMDAYKFKHPDLFYEKSAEAFKRALREVDLAALAQEEQAMAAVQEQNEAGFYRQRAQELQGQLEATQQQAMQAQEQMGQMQQLQAGHDAELQSAMQQAQMTQQSALTNVQQAHAVATQATQQALQASDEALKNQQLAASMRMAFQEMRGNIMDVASKDNAADIGAQLSGQGLETTPQTPDAGPAGQAPDPGLAPGQASPQGQEAAAADPSQSPNQPAAEPTTDAGVKESGVKERLVGGTVGGLLGAGATALEAGRGHGALRSEVQRLEAAGGGGFANALNLARAKAMLAAGEVAEAHPTAATIAGGVLGAGLGATAGPPLARQGKNLFGRV